MGEPTTLRWIHCRWSRFRQTLYGWRVSNSQEKDQPSPLADIITAAPGVQEPCAPDDTAHQCRQSGLMLLPRIMCHRTPLRKAAAWLSKLQNVVGVVVSGSRKWSQLAAGSRLHSSEAKAGWNVVLFRVFFLEVDLYNGAGDLRADPTGWR